MLSRLAKNQYEWKGIDQILLSIQRTRNASEDNCASNPSGRKKKKKSLGILCESFIKQFLTWRTTISLEQAARRISDNKIDESKLKTKVRRLYDIANVLAALNLIEKTSLETRKPAFKWVGEEGLQNFIQEMEVYFRTPKEKQSYETEFCGQKVSPFEFKSENLNSTDNSKITKPYSRLNSGNTSATFKIETQEEEELTFGNSRVKNFNFKDILNTQSTFPKVTAQTELNCQIMDLLERLNFGQRSFPVYKPTPIYPIGHFLSNPCTVSQCNFSHTL